MCSLPLQVASARSCSLTCGYGDISGLISPEGVFGDAYSDISGLWVLCFICGEFFVLSNWHFRQSRHLGLIELREVVSVLPMPVLVPFLENSRIVFSLFRWVALLTCFVIFSSPATSAAPKPNQLGKPDFSGNWTLDLQASSSLEPVMKQIEASPIDLKYATSTTLKATLQQTNDVLMVATRGPGFALDQTLYLDGRSDPSNFKLLGATSLNCKTAWSKENNELIESHEIKTKQGKEGRLTIKRHLTNGGQTLVVAFTAATQR